MAFVFCCVRTIQADDSRDALIVQTVLKLETFDYASSSEKVKGSIARYLDKNIGKKDYYLLVERLQLRSQIQNLVLLASKEEAPARAASLLASIGGRAAIVSSLKTSGNDRPHLILSLGTVNDSMVVAVIADTLVGGDQSESRIAARALAKSPAGQVKLLHLAEEKKLPQIVENEVALLLSASVDPSVRVRASKVIPLPSSLNGEPLPPVSELAKLRGNSKKGEAVYLRACFTCHRAGERGIDFGPALSEIGDKLAREAMYVAIIEPNQSISFGYEGFTVATKNGATIIGYVISDGDMELGMRVPGGSIVSTKRENIVSKVPLSVSLMPAGLIAAMGKGDLVDLVEFLMTLKK